MDSIELIEQAEKLGLPIEKDNYGQFIISTHLKEDDNGGYEEMTAADFDDESAWYK